MSMKIKVSVITTVFNAEKTIVETVKSVLKQSMKEFEYIIINDGSNDKTSHLIEEIKDKRLRIYSPGKIGRSRALNLALKKSVGVYIAIIDADDLCLPGRLIKQYNFFLKKKKCGLVCSSSIIINNKGENVSVNNVPNKHDDLITNILLLNPFSHSSIMFKRQDALDVGGYNNKCKKSIDFNFYLDLLNHGIRFYGISDPLIKLRLHENSWGRSDNQALQIKYGILGLVNFYQVKHFHSSFFECSEKEWDIRLSFFELWFIKNNFLKKSLAKKNFFISRKLFKQKYYFKSFLFLLKSFINDVYFIFYKGIGFKYPKDVLSFISYYNKYSKN